MEEEIIGNRWKELDYDGYYLVSTVVLGLTFSRSSSPPHGHSSHSVPTEEVREKDRKE